MQPVSLSVLTSHSGQRRPKKSQHTTTYNTASNTMTNTQHDEAKKEGKKGEREKTQNYTYLGIHLEIAT